MSLRRFAAFGLALAAAAATAGEAAAQATYTPTFHAPYRAFESQEFGAVLSFPDGANLGIEGQWRFGYNQYDIGVRGGIIDFDGGSNFVIGIEGRARVLDHTENDFPLDGAVIVGVGTSEFDNWIIPSAGISLGRRVVLEDFEFVAYGQPTMFLTTGNSNTDFDFNLGFGVDFKVGENLDLRTSFAFLDAPADGIAFGLVWVR